MVYGPLVVSFPDTRPSAGPGCGPDVPGGLWPWVTSAQLSPQWEDACRQPFLRLPWGLGLGFIRGSTSFGSELFKSCFLFSYTPLSVLVLVSFLVPLA